MNANTPHHGSTEASPEDAQNPVLKYRLFSDSVWALGGKLATAFTALASNALLARLLSPQDLGVYFLAFSVVAIASMLGSAIGQAVIRFVAESLGMGLHAKARNALGRVLTVGVVTALLLGAGYTLLGPVIGKALFHSPALAAVTGLVAGWLITITLQMLLAEAFRGFHDIRAASIFGGLASGILLTVSLGLLWLLDARASLSTILLLSAGSSAASTLLSGWLLHRKASLLPTKDSDSQVGFGEVLSLVLPLLVTNSTVIVLTQADLWILGAFRSPGEVALYGAAVRAVLLVMMPILVVNSVVSSRIAEMYAQGRKPELQRLLQAVTTLASICAFLAATGFFLAGGPILALVFGEYYREGALILTLLSIGQVVNVWAGASGMVLVMTRHQTQMMSITIVSSVITIVGGILIVNPYGAIGVAMVTAAGIIFCNVSLWLAAKRKTGIWTHASLAGFSDLLKFRRL